MHRRPNPRAELLRAAVAEEAARIMREQGVDDFLLAKRKAAERLGVTDASILPRNTEIEAARIAHQRLFAADRHEADLAGLRRAALEAMRLMSDFQPRLVGPVLDFLPKGPPFMGLPASHRCYGGWACRARAGCRARRHSAMPSGTSRRAATSSAKCTWRCGPLRGATPLPCRPA